MYPSLSWPMVIFAGKSSWRRQYLLTEYERKKKLFCGNWRRYPIVHVVQSRMYSDRKKHTAQYRRDCSYLYTACKQWCTKSNNTQKHEGIPLLRLWFHSVGDFQPQVAISYFCQITHSTESSKNSCNFLLLEERGHMMYIWSSTAGDYLHFSLIDELIYSASAFGSSCWLCLSETLLFFFGFHMKSFVSFCFKNHISLDIGLQIYWN